MQNETLTCSNIEKAGRFVMPNQEEIEEANRIRGKIISKMTFDTINSAHPFREEIKELARLYERNPKIKYSDIPLETKAKLTKLYMDYKKEDYYYEFILGKLLTEKILTSGRIELIDQAKIFKIIIDKYELDIDEYFCEEIEQLKAEWCHDMFIPRD